MSIFLSLALLTIIFFGLMIRFKRYRLRLFLFCFTSGFLCLAVGFDLMGYENSTIALFALLFGIGLLTELIYG